MPSLSALRTELQAYHDLQDTFEVLAQRAMSLKTVGQQLIDAIKQHTTLLETTFHKIGAQIPDEWKQPTLSKKLYIIFGASRGLAGPFHFTLSHFTKKVILEENLPEEQREIICFGERTGKELTRANVPYDQVISWEKPTIPVLQELITQHLPQPRPITLIYFEINGTPQCSHLIPLKEREHPGSDVTQTTKPTNAIIDDVIIIEGDTDSLLKAVIKKIVIARIWETAVASYFYEQIARFLAMESATNNCRDIHNTIQMIYNQQRQQIITSMIQDVVRTTMALKGG